MTAHDTVALAPRDLAGRVEEMLRRSLPNAHDISVSDPHRVFGGNARTAWACDASWTSAEGRSKGVGERHDESLILLIRATGSQVQSDPDDEFAALDGLAQRGVRAPRIWAQDSGGRLFGGAAVLLQRLPGRTDAVEYLHADLATGRARTHDLARALAELHVATTAADRDDSQLAGWRQQFEQARLEALPEVSWLFDWLARKQPTHTVSTLVHGDFRPGNVLYDGDRIVGLLDWEMAHRGSPAEDIAWAYRSLWSPARFVPIEEFVAVYHDAGGPTITGDALLWNRVFCEVKFATISLRAARSVSDGTSHNLRLIDRARTVVPSVAKALTWVDAWRAVQPC